MGTLNNCSYGETPWGTYLACEENFDSYFGTTDPAWVRTPEQARYGLSAAGTAVIVVIELCEEPAVRGHRT